MCQTTLMESQPESVIRGPAIMNQKSVICGAQNRYRLLVSSSWQDGVYGHLRAHRHMQPLEPSTYSPAGFVHAVDWSLACGFHQSVIGGLRATRHPRQGSVQSSAADLQPEAIGQDLPSVPQRQPHLFVEN